MTPALHQFVAGYSNSDAISNEARVLRAVFRQWGHASEIFCEQKRILPELRRDARDLMTASQAIRPDDIVLLHLSIGSPVNDLFRQINCRKAILYHNITPPEFFRNLHDPVSQQLEQGRAQTQALAGMAEVNLAVSEFNAAELRAAGYAHVGVLPLVLDFNHLRHRINQDTLTKYDDGRVNILFVGRGAPNKRIEDVLAAFYYFQKFVEPNSRLIHVGSYAGLEAYQRLLFTRIRELQVADAVLAGMLSQPELNACYRCASLFLCMSEHEGFCIPLIESMVVDVPILAYAAGAVPETLDGAGVLFHEKRFDLVAEMMGRLVHDERLRATVIAGQRVRLARYEQRDLAAELRQHLAPLLQKKA